MCELLVQCFMVFVCHEKVKPVKPSCRYLQPYQFNGCLLGHSKNSLYLVCLKITSQIAVCGHRHTFHFSGFQADLTVAV